MAARPQIESAAERAFPLPESTFIPWFFRRALERFLRLDQAEEDCGKLRRAENLSSGLEPIVRARGIDPNIVRACAKTLPDKGPLLITSNHPTGILDGVILAIALLDRHQNVKVVANRMLEKVPHLSGHLIPVDKTGGKTAALQTFRAIRKAWQENASVVLFPAGTVAHWQFSRRAVAEAPATQSVQQLAAKLEIPHYQATLFLRNPAWFHWAAAISRQARTALLMRAFYAGPKVLRVPPLEFREIEQPKAPASHSSAVGSVKRAPVTSTSEPYQ